MLAIVPPQRRPAAAHPPQRGRDVLRARGHADLPPRRRRDPRRPRRLRATSQGHRSTTSATSPTQPLRMILTFTPAGIERFFEETLERAYDLDAGAAPTISPRSAPATPRPARATAWSSSSTPDPHQGAGLPARVARGSIVACRYVVIVGGGAAGCVAVARLSESSARSVLLAEPTVMSRAPLRADRRPGLTRRRGRYPATAPSLRGLLAEPRAQS